MSERKWFQYTAGNVPDEGGRTMNEQEARPKWKRIGPPSEWFLTDPEVPAEMGGKRMWVCWPFRMVSSAFYCKHVDTDGCGWVWFVPEGGE